MSTTGDVTMDGPGSLLLHRIISDFDDTYLKFLEKEGLRDTAPARVSFFMAAQRMVEKDPLPDKGVQTVLLAYFAQRTVRALDDYFEKIGEIHVTRTTRERRNS